MLRTFVTDAEVAAITTACEQTGAGSLVVPEIIASLEQARAAEEMVKLLLSGRAIPKIAAGELRYDLTDAGRDEIAGTLTAAVMRELAGTVRP